MTTQVDKDDMQAAFVWMQGRMVELLLRHDVVQFEHLFREWLAPPEQTTDTLDTVQRAVLARYRRLAVLVYLQKDLFESILPRIKRHLSFTAPHTRIIEEPPARGRIDWSRTAAATWRDTPDQPPLMLSTRQRRRHFATPENLLTVVTLLEYQAAVQQQLDHESTTVQNQAFRHPLHDIIAACTRELVFPQFAGLVAESTAIVQGVTQRTAETLEQEVVAHLLPGHNSAYDDLLSWRHKLRELRLLDPTADAAAQSMLGSNPEQDNYLYQLWLFYELRDLLVREDRLLADPAEAGVLLFRWGIVGEERRYRLQHDQEIPICWRTARSPGSSPAPGTRKLAAPRVRPDFYIERIDPPRQVIQDGQNIIWHEPGYVLDAKYYQPRDSFNAPSEPIKRMIADLQLTGERHGALLFAFQQSAIATDTSDPLEAALYSIIPQRSNAQAVPLDTRVDIWRIPPVAQTGHSTTEETLTRILQAAHQALSDPVEVRCHGIFLDMLTRTAHRDLADGASVHSADTLSTQPDDDRLLCPKPHIAPGYAIVVSRTHDCLTSVRCHVRHLGLKDPPQRITSIKEITSALHAAGRVPDREQAVAIATQHVEVITRRYAELVQPNLGSYRARVRRELDVFEDEDLEPLLDRAQLLSDTHWETLALGYFLAEQIELIQAHNYAGPALLFTGALEAAINASIYPLIPSKPIERWTKDSGEPLPRTLGPLALSKGDPTRHITDKNWRLLRSTVIAGGHWKADIAPDCIYTFSQWIDTLASIVPIRNMAAHEASTSFKAFRKLRAALFGDPQNESLGLLNGLLLAWVP
jgi:hypothetical protein